MLLLISGVFIFLLIYKANSNPMDIKSKIVINKHIIVLFSILFVVLIILAVVTEYF